MPLKKKVFPGQIASRLAKARTATAKRVVLTHALSVARRMPTARGARGVAAHLTVKEVIAAANAKWDARATVLDTFLLWCADVDTWCGTQDRSIIARLPVALWPSRMAEAARKWARGTGGTDPEKLRTAFAHAQAIALDATVPYTPEHFWVEEWVGWAGPLSAPIANDIYYADFADGDTSPLFELGSASFEHCRLVFYGFGADDGFGNLVGPPPGIVLQQCSFDSCADVTELDFAPAFNFTDPAHFTLDSNNAAQTACNLLLDLAAPYRWRLRFTEAITGLYLGGQVHCYKRTLI